MWCGISEPDRLETAECLTYSGHGGKPPSCLGLQGTASPLNAVQSAELNWKVVSRNQPKAPSDSCIKQGSWWRYPGNAWMSSVSDSGLAGKFWNTGSLNSKTAPRTKVCEALRPAKTTTPSLHVHTALPYCTPTPTPDT